MYRLSSNALHVSYRVWMGTWPLRTTVSPPNRHGHRVPEVAVAGTRAYASRGRHVSRAGKTRGGNGDFCTSDSHKMATETSIGKSFSFPTRLLSQSGSAVQASTSWSRNPARSLGQALVKNHGHDVLARSARTPVLSAMSALNASAQRGQDDMRGFAGRARNRNAPSCQ